MAEQLLKTMTRKFKESSKVWLAYVTAKLREGKHDEARSILQRSLKSLPKRKCTTSFVLLLLLFSLPFVIPPCALMRNCSRSSDKQVCATRVQARLS